MLNKPDKSDKHERSEKNEKHERHEKRAEEKMAKSSAPKPPEQKAAAEAKASDHKAEGKAAEHKAEAKGAEHKAEAKGAEHKTPADSRPAEHKAEHKAPAEAKAHDHKPPHDKSPEKPVHTPPPAPHHHHRPTVIIIGADKGGVGKTTVTRTLLDYLAARHIPRRAFDTESPKGTLKRFHPDITEIVDVTQAQDQMKIFDTINAAEATVIDVRAGLLSTTLGALRDIGFMDHAKSSDYTFAVFHILGPSIASLEEIADTADLLTGAHHFLVKNFINNTTFFDWDPSTYNGYFKKIKGVQELTIPRLNELACEQVELSAIPFHTFAANQTADGKPANYSFVLRGYVRHWLHKVFAEYDRARLTELIHHRQKVA